MKYSSQKLRYRAILFEKNLAFRLYNSKTIKLSSNIKIYLNRADKDILEFIYIFLVDLIDGSSIAFIILKTPYKTMTQKINIETRG